MEILSVGIAILATVIDMDIHFAVLSGFAVALGGGMLIGIERERRKGSGPQRSLAGIRTLALTGLCGAMTQAIDEPMLIVAGAALFTVLTMIKRVRDGANANGVATGSALLLTYAFGVLAIENAQLASVAFSVTAALFAYKYQYQQR